MDLRLVCPACHKTTVHPIDDAVPERVACSDTEYCLWDGDRSECVELEG